MIYLEIIRYQTQLIQSEDDKSEIHPIYDWLNNHLKSIIDIDLNGLNDFDNVKQIVISTQKSL